MTNDDPVRWVEKTAFAMPLLPPALRVDPVLAALVHCAAFLELSGDDTVDPDWAVEAMEHVSAYLGRLSESDVRSISEQLARVGEYARGQGAPDAFVQFIDRFLYNFGVAEAPG